MWNQFGTNAYEGLLAETATITKYNNELINAYFARPLGPGPFPGIILVHHLPGWDEFYRETARRFAQHGYAAICPNLYQRFGDGTPEEVAATARGQGGVRDESVIGDCEAAMRYLKALPTSNGRVGIIGTCSGGRHSFLVACRVNGFSAAVDCWGGRVVMSEQELTVQQPVAPIQYTKDLQCPLLGIFGNDDTNPSPEMVERHEAEIKKHGKTYEFHRYDGAGHGFWYYDRTAYRPQQAMDAWQKVFAFFSQHLQG
ncbi:MAG: dienelactone hydrolase family protein [Chloroflexi bacterium]|nr:dienelactone hydrolase family protein [Chloroflexota bacterium]